MFTKAIVDLDGVLIDFVGGALKAHGVNKKDVDIRNPSLYRELGLTVEEFWHPLKKHEFWSELNWLPDGKQILQIIESSFSDIVICTSPGIEPYAASGKMEWIIREIPSYLPKLLIGRPKHFLASPESILFDDLEKNTSKFEKWGGSAILVPRPWNKHRYFDTFNFVRRGTGI